MSRDMRFNKISFSKTGAEYLKPDSETSST